MDMPRVGVKLVDPNTIMAMSPWRDRLFLGKYDFLRRVVWAVACMGSHIIDSGLSRN